MTAVVTLRPDVWANGGEERPWSLQALEDVLGAPSTVMLARILGVDRRQLYRWRVYGLTDAQADHLAISVGTHPALVWAGW